MIIGNFLRRLTPKKLQEVFAYLPGDEFSKKIYSQEGEDILLSRIFDKQQTGFYVDVGAHHPFRFSNTKLLYDKGWSGINIEPNPDSIDLFNKHRPRDTTLNFGVGQQTATLEYYFYAHPALNSFDRKTVESRTKRPISSSRIQVYPLAELLKEHLPSNVRISLLSIDVEGMDLDVLKSNDWNLYSPSYILVESDPVSLHDTLNLELTLFLEGKSYNLISKLHRSLLFKLRS